jgi:hypothetical protein
MDTIGEALSFHAYANEYKQVLRNAADAKDDVKWRAGHVDEPTARLESKFNQVSQAQESHSPQALCAGYKIGFSARRSPEADLDGKMKILVSCVSEADTFSVKTLVVDCDTFARRRDTQHWELLLSWILRLNPDHRKGPSDIFRKKGSFRWSQLTPALCPYVQADDTMELAMDFKLREF